MLDERDRLIAEHGLVLVGEEASAEAEEEEEDAVGESSNVTKGKKPLHLVTKEAADILKEAGEGSLDNKVKKLSEENQNLLDQIHRLTLDNQELKAQSTTSRSDLQDRTARLNGPDSQIVASAQSMNLIVSSYELSMRL